MRHAFVHAAELRVGDELLLPEGKTASVTHIRSERALQGDTFTTYNFAVAETCTYFVGRTGVWVHNMSNVPCKQAAANFVGNSKKMPLKDAVAKMRAELTDLAEAGKIDPKLIGKHQDDALQQLKKSGAITQDEINALKSQQRDELGRFLPIDGEASIPGRLFEQRSNQMGQNVP